MNMETVTATGDHGSITFRKADGVVVERDFYRGARKTSPFRARMNSATAKPF